MRTEHVESSSLNGRQIAFEVASAITTGVGIMVDIIRRLYHGD